MNLKTIKMQIIAGLATTMTILAEVFPGGGTMQFVRQQQTLSVGKDFAEMLTGSREVSFCCEMVPIPASRANLFRVDFSSDKAGYLLFSWTVEIGTEKKTLKYRYPLSVIPDGQARTFQFFLADEPDRIDTGVVTGWKIDFISPEPLAKTKVSMPEFVDEINLIPRAEKMPVRTLVLLDCFRPRGKYVVEWVGRSCSGLKITFLNHELKPLPDTEVYLTVAGQPVEFTAPENVACGSLFLEGDSAGGYPRLRLKEFKPMYSPKKFWRGNWIWSQKELGPFHSHVWFRKELILNEAPEYGVISIMADDGSRIYVNGQWAGYSSKFFKPFKWDISKLLKKGTNIIEIDVFNGVLQAGVCADIYVQSKTGEDYFCTDDTWQCEETGKSDKRPQMYSGMAVDLGKPAETQPWASRVKYVYAGPRGKLELLEAAEGRLRVKVISAPPVLPDSLGFRVKYASGREVKFTLPVTLSGKPAAGTQLEIAFARFPDTQEDCEIWLDDEYLVLSLAQPLFVRKGTGSVRRELQKASFVHVGGRTKMIFGGREYLPVFYQTPGEYDRMATAIRAGIHLLSVGAILDQFWKGEDQYDFSSIDNNVEQILFHDKEAILLLNIGLFMPEWWLTKNPDDVTRYFEGTPRNTYFDMQALGSKKWLQDAAVPLKALVEHIKESSWGYRVWGASLAESRNSEWFWGRIDNNWKRAWAGYSPADYKTFRQYLREKYGTEEALRAAWKQPDVTFETAEMPSPDSVNKPDGSALLSPAEDAPILDWFFFRNQVFYEALHFFAGKVKEYTGGAWLCGAYYGYFNELVTNTAYPQQTTGHNAFVEAVGSPYLDFFRAPSRYSFRQTGMPGAFMQPFSTFSLNGKVLFCENDERNAFGSHDSAYSEIYAGRASGGVESIGHFNREFGMCIATGHVPYWYDMPHGSLYEVTVAEILRKQQEAYAALPPVKGFSPAEIAVVSDRNSIYHLTFSGSNIFTAAVYNVFTNIHHLAVPYRNLDISDLLEKQDILGHKLYIMLPTIVLSQKQRDALAEKFKREKATVIWLYCAGVNDPDKAPDAGNYGDFLGLKCQMRSKGSGPMHYNLNGQARKFNSNFQGSPSFIPESGFDNVLGTNRDSEPLLVSVKSGEALHYFSSLADIPLDLLGKIVRDSGVFSYSENRKDTYWIGNDVIFVTAVSGGEKSIVLPQKDLRLKAMIGPLEGSFQSGEKWESVPGFTCGFLIEKDENN